MPQKRKACETLEEPWREEVSHESPAEIPKRGKTFTSILPASQAMGGAAGASKDSQQLHEVGTSAVAQAKDLCTRVSGTGGEASKSHSTRKVSAGKKRITEETLLKRMSMTCEWYMCTAEFNKVERFMSHITEHLQAITGLCSDCHSPDW